MQESFKQYPQTFEGTQKQLDKTSSIIDKYVLISQTDTNGIIVYVSQAFCNISGYERKELIGKTHKIIKHPDNSPAIFEDMWSTITHGKVWHGEIKNKKKNGDYYWVEATIEPIFDEQSDIIGYDAIRQDITSKKELQEQQNVIIEQSKAAAMGEMISMIAHQWRQPLQAVSILVQKLPITKMIEGDLSDELIDQVVDDVGKQLEYMSKTIDDFRDFFRPDKDKDIVAVSKIIDKAQNFLNPILRTQSVNLTIDGDSNIKIFTHINEVVQVLINIIKNALDVMKERKIEDKKIWIRFYTKDKSLLIEIEDNAGGIDNNVINKVFDPYFSTKTNKNGTGLGLYMTKTIIEKHCDGTIFVKNGKFGALFSIIMPIG